MSDKRKVMGTEAVIEGLGRRQAKRMKAGAATTSPEDQTLGRYHHVKNNVLQRVLAHPHESWVLYETTHTFAMLDGRPQARGHTLVVSKEQAATLLDGVTEQGLLAMAKDVQAVSKALHQVTQCAGIKVQQLNGPAAGQTIPQLHTIIVPCYGPRAPAPGPVTATSGVDETTGSELQDSDAGPLTAALRNQLPANYAPGFHYWAPSVEHMEAIGHVIQSHFCRPGHVVLLNGQLGAGKSTIARGVVRSYVGDAHVDVPSPTFLLCLTYEDDQSHEKTSTTEKSTAHRPRRMHHMDPYRLGQKTDRLAGLLDFNAAMSHDVCLVEWPDRMPSNVMALAKKGVNVQISGYGSQGAGRLVTINALRDDEDAHATLLSWRSQGLPQVDVMWRSTPAVQASLTSTREGSQGRGVMAALPSDSTQWLVLGIESSCDDTAAAVVRGDGVVLAHEIASQTGLHEQYGGVKPDTARDAHAAAITGTVDRCLAKAGVTPKDLTAVAVTIGPGLSLCLQVGVRHALTIAATHATPIIPVHHMEAHALMARMPTVNPQPLTFPALLLLVSGGHNMLVLCSGVGKYRIIGTTLDDSVGECFDKTARLLGFSAIPGGPLLEKLALRGDAAVYKNKITMPMQNGQHKDSCNFSFSGLKTSVGKLVDEIKIKLGLLHHSISLKLDPESGEISCTATISSATSNGSTPSQQQQTARKAAPATDNGVALQQSVTAAAVTQDHLQDHFQGHGTVNHPQQQPSTTAAAAAAADDNSQRPCHDRTASDMDSLASPDDNSTGGAGEGVLGSQGRGFQQEGEAVSDEVRRTYVKAAADVAAAYTNVAVRFLQQRTARALQWLQDDQAQQGGDPITCLVVAGGVAANAAVRAGLTDVATRFSLPCVCPPVKYCTDNGLMVAWAGVERLRLGLCEAPPAPDKVDGHVQVLPRWPLGPLDPRSALGSSACKLYQ